MALKQYIKLSLLLLTLIASGCRWKPKACFTADQQRVAKNTLVNFTNCSVDADAYEWTFNNISNSESENPSKYFTEKGTFEVTLTAYSKNRKFSDKTSLTIEVGEKIVSKVVAHYFPFRDENGISWDTDGTGPDYKLGYTSIKSDVTQADFPLTWYVESQEINITPSIDENNLWNFYLYEVDNSFYEEADSIGIVKESMLSNPYNYTHDSVNLDIYWKIKMD